MDDELQQLEAELKQLRPAAPSRELRARLDRELKLQPHTSRAWWLWAGAMPVAAAIAVALILATRRDHTQPPPTQVAAATLATFKPVAAENVLYAAQDDGPVTLADGTSARRERLSYVDTITWKDPRTNASVRWSVPREEVRVVPVSFQ